VRLTAAGRAGLLDAFGVDLAAHEPALAAAAKVPLRA
jgi:hypothetical protein